MKTGSAIAGAAYTVTDSNGHSYSVTTDDAGTAVTPLMALGEATIRTQRAPEGYDDAAQVQAQAAAGEAAQVELLHESHGTGRFTVSLQGLDANGNPTVRHFPARRTAYSVQDGGQRMNDTGVELQTDENGTCEVCLEAGEYTAQVQNLPTGMTAPQAARFTVRNTQQTDVALTCMDALGGRARGVHGRHAFRRADGAGAL